MGARRHALGRVNDRAAIFVALLVPIWRIGFLIIAGRRERTSGKFCWIYDFAATESQIEFGEAAIMETNELTGGAGAQTCCAEERLNIPFVSQPIALAHITAPICQGTNSRSP